MNMQKMLNFLKDFSPRVQVSKEVFTQYLLEHNIVNIY